MAQAARLNLRMQREIKLLLNDPPPGVSLNLSEHESALSSLLSFEARIEGPEGTVYSKGIFVLKIQIPERYPFQPPNVTFVTPIYHPNIDNGGRICLDILNLPPKGAWQPSLNISTVLTSIGLLLSEPNPDDGLMAEISREYKYNRQVFDVNARSWTEKYANSAAIGTRGWSSVDVPLPAQKSQMEEVQSLETLPEVSNIECEKVSRKKMRLLGQKLPLKSEPEENTTSRKQNLVASHLPSTARSTDPTTGFSHDVSAKQSATSEDIVVSSDNACISNKECQGNRKNLQLGRPRPSFTSQAPSNRGNINGELPKQLLASASNPKDPIMRSFGDVLEKSISMTKSTDCSSENLNKASEGTRVNVKLLSQKLSLKSEKHETKSNDHKENLVPNHFPSSISSSNTLLKGSSDVDLGKSSSGGGNLVQQHPNVTENTVVPNAKVISNKECDGNRKKLSLLNKKLSLKSELAEMDRDSNREYKPSDCSQKDGKPNELPLSASIPKDDTIGFCFADSKKAVNQSSCPIKQSANAVETIVVSDSEESADECDRPSRSRLSLMKRRLAGKLKS